MNLFARANFPGFSTAVESEESQVYFAGRYGETGLTEYPVVVDSTVTDSGNTPTTTLRGGNIMQRRDSDGNVGIYSNAVAGRVAGVLPQHLDMLSEGVVADRWTQLFTSGYLKVSELIGGTPALYAELVKMGFQLDDADTQLAAAASDGVTRTIAGAVTLVAQDAGLTFFQSAAATPTLPTAAAATEGLKYTFQCITADDIIITSPVADKILTIGDAAATTVTITDIGAKCTVQCMDTTGAGAYLWVVTEGIGTITPA